MSKDSSADAMPLTHPGVTASSASQTITRSPRAARTPALRARLAPTVAHSTSRRFVSRPNQLCTIAAVSSWEPLSMTTISHGSG